MADTTKLTPYERFHALLVPNPANTEAVRMVQDNPTLKAASAAYQKALETDKAQEVVYNLATQLAGDFNLRPEDVRNSFIESQPLPPTRPQENATTNQPPINANPLQGLFGGGEEKSASLPARVGDRATPVLRSVQEEQLLHEFEEALNDTGPDREDKIRNLLDRMEAPNLIGNQVDIVKEHILNTERVQSAMQQELKKAKTQEERDAIEKKFKEKLDNDLDVQGEKKKKAWHDAQQNPNKTEVQKARDTQTKALDEQLKTNLRQTIQGGDKNKARDAFQRLLTHRMNQTHGYSILEEYASPSGSQDLMLEQLRSILTRVHSNAYAARQQRSQMLQQAAAQQEQAQRQPPGQNGLQKIAQKAIGQKINPFTKQGLQQLTKGGIKKAVGQGIKKGLLAALKEPHVLAIIGLVFLAIILLAAIIIVFIMLIQQLQKENQNQNKPTPIPGLTLGLTTDPPGQTHYANGQDIKTIIDIKYSGPYSLVVTDKDPANADVDYRKVTGRYSLGDNATVWYLDANKPLPDSTATQKHWQFSIVFTHVGKDLVFHNEITTTYAVGSGPQAGPSPTPGGKPSAGGYCSPNNLAKYFGSTQAGQTASCICKYESGGDPSAINKACLTGKTADWSVGLFQINLDTNPQRCSGAFLSTGLVCKVADNRTLNRCTQSLLDPTNNINAAVTIYHASHNSWENGWRAEKGKCF